MPIIQVALPDPQPELLPQPLPPKLQGQPTFPTPRPKLFPLPWFRECTPRLLVVTDNLNYSPGDFGLTEFVDTLRSTPIHGLLPTVVTARFDPNPAAVLSFAPATQHIDNFKFTDPTHGVLESRYDVVFILSINGIFGPKLIDEIGALDAVTRFMQAGGGVFATGDHEDLGAAMCMDIPRVKNMRYWANTATQKVPSASLSDRLTTNLPGRSDVPGSDDTYEFADQSDQFPQRLYVNYRTEAGGIGMAHPLLQLPASARAIEVFPDHPHEGECVVPTDLTSKLPDGVSDEWPTVAGAQPIPEMVALTMSHGNSFPGKEAVTPRSFIAICAYDGHAAQVGRVVTDATWHHFVNINIKPGLSAIHGRDLSDIKQYYSNLATWLMPQAVRYCRRFPWLLTELMSYPLFEELSPIPRKELGGERLRAIGELVERALLQRHTTAQVGELLADTLEEAIGAQEKSTLQAQGRQLGLELARHAALAGLGSLALATAERFNDLGGQTEVDGEAAFEGVGKKATAAGAKLYLRHSHRALTKLHELVSALEH
jgi:hypothetical protein